MTTTITSPATLLTQMTAAQGVAGISAYAVAIKNGYTGTEAEWLLTLVGPAWPSTGVQAASEAARDAAVIAKDLAVAAKDTAVLSATNANDDAIAVALAKSSVDSSTTTVTELAAQVNIDVGVIAGYKDTVALDKAAVALDKATVASDKLIVSGYKDTVALDKAVVALDKAAVAADKLTVSGYKDAVDSDRSDVALDKAAVAADKLTVSGYKDTVALDKAAVALDKAVVSADKLTVSGYKDAVTLDKAAVALDTATVAADKLTVAGYKDTVATDKTDTLGYKNSASDSAVAAALSASNADTSEAMAQAWAITPTDTAVSGSDYSALHWAAKSAESQGIAGSFATSANDAKVAAQAAVVAAGNASRLTAGTVTAGAAAVTITGEPGSQVLNLVIPPGATGATGATGPAGPTDYTLLTNAPTLGTAAAMDVPAAGNAGSTQVVKGSDTRLTDARTPTDHGHAATATPFNPAGGIAATTVQAAIEELDAEKLPLAGGNLTGPLNFSPGAGQYSYNLSTDASNYERYAVTWEGGTLRMNAEKLGVGTQRNIGLQTAGGNVGIGMSTPAAKLHIVAGASDALIVQANTGKDLFHFLKQNGSSLWRATWDTSNFHHHLTGGSLYYNLNGNWFFIDGNGGANSGISITGGAKFKITPNIDGSSKGIVSGDSNYATSLVPLVTNRLIEFGTWAWNGTNGYSVAAKTEIVQQQLSTANGDARIYFKNVTLNSELLSILTLSGNVGIGTTSPSEKLHVTGNIKSTGAVLTGSTTVSGLPSAAALGAGARHFVTDATATTFLSVVSGGGSNKVPVVSDGTNWLIG